MPSSLLAPLLLLLALRGTLGWSAPLRSTRVAPVVAPAATLARDGDAGGKEARRRVASSPRLAAPSPFPPPDMGGASMGGVGGGTGVGGLGYQTTAWPLRVMVFIDGSWLYYSFHGRRPNCPVTQRYGEGWAFKNTVAFERLPYLISQHIHEQLLRRHGVSRFVEVRRSCRITSLDRPGLSPVVVPRCRHNRVLQSDRLALFR